MSSAEVDAIVKDLERWALGELGSKLTWENLESTFRFSRQSLQAKPQIKAAYAHAKSALSGGLVKSREQASKEVEELSNKIKIQDLQIKEYQKREMLWKQRWQRIAFHIRQKGIQMDDIDKPIEVPSISLTEAQVEKILKPFDKKIPLNGRV